MKKSTLVLAGITILAVLLYTQRAAVIERLMARGLEARMSANTREEIEDGLHLAL